jgi:imidazolonepropionase-like amidohydrolase
MKVIRHTCWVPLASRQCRSTVDLAARPTPSNNLPQLVLPIRRCHIVLSVLFLLICITSLHAQVAVRAGKLYTMAGPPIEEGVVVIRNGKVATVGAADDVNIPEGMRVLEGAVATPGLIDAHSVVGLAGYYNSERHDQEQLEHSTAMQPELRAIDAYNPRERLVEWLRGFGVTTVHTGHAPGELISGQTMIVKTAGDTVDEALVVRTAAVAVTLGPGAERSGSPPGTRSKMMAMLRQRLIQAREYLQKRRHAEPDKRPPVDLASEVLGGVLKRKVPLLVTAQRAQDIASALRLAEEFNIRVILDGAAESYLLIDQIKAARVPVIIHPTMARFTDDLENASFETAAKLRHAGISVALQSGYESYVPKTRVVLFEAALAAANGLTFEEALGTITLDAARILGIDDRVGSLAVGKDGDVALFDGDPFEYTTHCTATVIAGRVVSDEPH